MLCFYVDGFLFPLDTFGLFSWLYCLCLVFLILFHLSVSCSVAVHVFQLHIWRLVRGRKQRPTSSSSKDFAQNVHIGLCYRDLDRHTLRRLLRDLSGFC